MAMALAQWWLKKREEGRDSEEVESREYRLRSMWKLGKLFYTHLHLTTSPPTYSVTYHIFYSPTTQSSILRASESRQHHPRTQTARLHGCPYSVHTNCTLGVLHSKIKDREVCVPGRQMRHVSANAKGMNNTPASGTIWLTDQSLLSFSLLLSLNLK